jgi:hypothetical protein
MVARGMDLMESLVEAAYVSDKAAQLFARPAAVRKVLLD